MSDQTVRKSSIGRTVKAYITLTKPRVLELLLVSTVPVMFLAQGDCRTCGSCWRPSSAVR